MSRAGSSLGRGGGTRAGADEMDARAVDQERVESLLAAERRTLEMIASGASLPDILEDLCSTIDAQGADTISSVLLMEPDDDKLWPAAGSRVPD